MIAILFWALLWPSPATAPTAEARASAGVPQEPESPEEREAREKREREELVQRAVTELRDAARAPEARTRVAVLERWKELEDPRVIAEFGVALRADEQEVRTVAIDALRWMKHEDALGELQALVKRDRKLHKDPELHASVLKAIGQHGSASSIDVLTTQVGREGDKEVLRACVLGLGNIRSRRALDALYKVMTSMRTEEVAKVMSDFRLSLMRLTGVDRGISPEEWQRWRREAASDFEVAAEAPRLPDMEQNLWNAYWGLERVGEGARRRERRGEDPERRRGDGGK